MQIQCEKDGPHGDTAAIVPANSNEEFPLENGLNQAEENGTELPATASASIQ